MDLVPDLGSLAAAAGIGYGLYGAQLFVRQASIVFKPTRTHFGDPSSLGCRFDHVRLETRGRQLHGWWIDGSEAGRTFLFLPGSIGNISRDLHTFALLQSVGGTVLAIDYPGFGTSEGRPSEAGCYAAAEAAWDYIVGERRVPPENVVIFGRSVGAAVAAWLAARRPCGALVCQSPLTSIADVAARSYPLLPTRFFCYVRFNTRRHIAQCRCPVLVMHSEEDTVIPIEQGYRVFERARPPKRFLQIGGDHYGDAWQQTPRVRDTLRELAVGREGVWA